MHRFQQELRNCFHQKDIQQVTINSAEIFSGQRSVHNGIFETVYSGKGKTRELKRIFDEQKITIIVLVLSLLG